MIGKMFDLGLPVSAFLQTLWSKNEMSGLSFSSQLIELFQALAKVNCDYYDLLSIYSGHELSDSEQEALLRMSPAPKSVLTITREHVRECIPRWTASRFHTATISDVVENIYFKLFSGKPGISVYDSNLNPRNQKAVNDRYVLIIQNGQKAFMDINRRSTVLFK